MAEVLPPQNLGSDKDIDFLRLALADEIATALSYARSLTIRPFATTSKYDAPNLDLQEAGKSMHVADIVTGHFLKEGNRLQITLEAVDVADNRTLWRDTMSVAVPDLIAMQSQITAKVRQGLVPALGAGTDASESATRPRRKPTIFTCAASPCPTKPSRTPMRSPCWNAPSDSIPATLRPGRNSAGATISILLTGGAARPRTAIRVGPGTGTCSGS